MAGKRPRKAEAKVRRPTKSYLTLSDITDLAGLRVITYLAKDVDFAAEIVRREFELDEENTIDKRKGDPEKLGYQSLHYICKYSKKRLELFEYEKFADTKFEVQIRSLLQHAWAELQHGAYDLQSNIPDEIKTRFSCLSGLLQLADREFSSILEEQAKYAKSTAVIVETNAGDLGIVSLNALSLSGFVESSPKVKELDAWIASRAGVNLEKKITVRVINNYSLAANFVGLKTLKDLSEALNKYESDLRQFEEKSVDWIDRPALIKSLPFGISVYRMSLLLAAKQGFEFTEKMLQAIGMDSHDNATFIANLIAAAQQIDNG